MLHILTLTWNGLSKLQDLKSGLEANLVGLDYTWHIRDNGSKDGTVEAIKDWNAKIYPMSHNKDNFAQGMNYLADQVSLNDEDQILLLNNDVVFNGNNSIGDMLLLQEKTKADVVGARLLYNNTNKLQHAGVIFSDRYGRMPYHYRPNETSDSHSEKNRYFQAVTAAVALVNASAFKKVNGFNNDYIWSFEDIDLFLKIGQLKKNNIVYCGQTNIFHEESASLKKNPVNKLFVEHNVKIFKNNWFGKYEIDHDKYLKDPNFNLV